MERLEEFLRKNSQGDLLPWSAQVQAASQFGVALGRVEETALELKILPARYQRNRRTISTDDQLRLFRSIVAVVGCGGLGGYMVEELARLGVGTIRAMDPDVFEEHNLNRQILCTIENLGTSKTEAARTRAEAINPAVQIMPIREAVSAANGAGLLQGAHVVLDALDSVPARMELADLCETLEIPLVHGSIGGWYGQIVTQLPGDRTVQKLYGTCKSQQGVETVLGNPAFTPAVIASLQVAECCKILLGQGSPLRNRMLFINMLDMVMEEIVF
jgi:molybdopterin-synthase adenylyltransferase